MVQKNKIYAVAFALLVVGCSADPAFDNGGVLAEVSPTATIYNSPEGAREGEILVKFRSSASADLDLVAPATRSGVVEITRSGIAAVDEQLDALNATSLSRVFPVNTSREEITRENNLHLWYVVNFDESLPLSSVAQQLAELPQIEVVEFSRTKQLAFDRDRRARTSVAQNTVVARAASASAPFNDPDYANQWHLNNTGAVPALNNIATGGADINAEAAWEVEYGTPEIIVAVLDEGVMYDHPDLAANVWVNEAEEHASFTDADGNGYAGDRYGYNFVLDKGIISYNKSGDTGHGTHVAGLVAAVNNNGVGISSIAGGSGIGDGVRVMICQIIDGYNMVSVYEEAKAIKYAADNGAVILQCSWGYNSGTASYPNSSGYESDEEWLAGSALEKDALDYFINNAGSPSGVIDGGIAIFAAGNEYASMACYPSRYQDYISVTALAADYTPSSFTNYDPLASIAAPGGDYDYHLASEGSIYSLVCPTPDYGNILYDYMDGTSMACPQVSGVVALALSRAYKLKKHFKATDFIDIIKASAAPIDDYFTGIKTYSYYYSGHEDKNLEQVDLSRYVNKMGSGVIDARALLDMVGSDGAGTAMKIPNYTVVLGSERRDDLSQYFVDSSMTFSATVASSDIATVSLEGSILTVKAVAEGSTTVKITSDGGVDQTITVIVRQSSSYL